MSVHKGFDAARECASVVDFIPDDQDFAVRYYSHNPAKNLSHSEAVKLTAADLQLVAVWESAGTKASFFSRDQGGKDATVALALADKVGQPEGSAIYFAVDFDASAVQVADRIIPYFDAIAKALSGKYEVGVYGSGLVCRTLISQGPTKYGWLACANWAGRKTFADWHIRQTKPNDDSLGLGFLVDLNDTAGDDYGQFIVE